MPFSHGPVVAPPDVPPSWWLPAFAPERAPLVLEPGSLAGWFGGLGLVACDPRLVEVPPEVSPVAYERTPGLSRAAALLEAALASRRPVMCAALLGYDGSVRVGVFRRGLVRGDAGWRAWGEWAGESLPRPVPVAPLAEGLPLTHGAVATDAGRRDYCRGIERATSAMGDGEVYVLNLCRRLVARPAASPAVSFATLLARTRAQMAACWLGPDRSLLSASPERFIRLERGLLTVEPIKGTRPRAPEPGDDLALAADLLASEKERAEHLMVVDLERNDIGRVCLPGSVVVSPLMAVVTTPYCHQLVSRVGGTLPAGARLADVLAATFPCGSVTGAPKRAAMEHIGRIERTGRGEYTGALVVAVPGRLDSSVLIRTAVLADGRLSYGVGCGVTVDSDPRAEWEETVTKASPLLGSSAVAD